MSQSSSVSVTVEEKVEEKPWIRAVAPHALVCFLLYALTAAAHFRAEYVLLALFWSAITFAGPRSRRFANVALPFVIVGLLYDQVLPHLFAYRPEPHVSDLYHLERTLFGIQTPYGVLIPSEWLEHHTSAWLDAPTGFVYMTYMFEAFIVAAWMYFQDREQAGRLAWAFLIVNILGFTSWILFPAAPPWYVTQYGLGPAHMDAIPSPAGCARFDALFGITYFSGFYARSHNVYGAMPSLHVAYPLVVLISVMGLRQRWIKIFAVIFFLLVAFAAVYLQHHYVIDVIAGVAVSFAAWGIMVPVRSALLRRKAGVSAEEAPAVAAQG